MDAREVIRNLTEMMMTADNEKEFKTLDGALKLVREKERNTIAVPCNIGDTLYSIIGEKVNGHVITGFRIEKDMVYMESQGSMLFDADKVGIFYFWSQDLAEREFNKKWGKKH